jgi:hypothetical protein
MSAEMPRADEITLHWLSPSGVRPIGG